MAKLPSLDDDLNGIIPAGQPNTHTAAETAPTKVAVSEADDDEQDAAAPKSNAKAFDSNGVTEWGDEKIMTRTDGLDRVRPEKGKVVRFSILPFLKPRFGKSHYVDAATKKGMFSCLTPDGNPPAICCQKLGDGKLQVVALVIVYKNANPTTGKYLKDAAGNIPPIEWKLGFVNLGQSNFISISKLPGEDHSVYDLDIAMSHRGNQIGYEFSTITSRARWKANPELAKEVEAAAKPFLDGVKLTSKLGRRITLLEWKTMLGGLKGAPASTAQEAALVDTDEV